MNNNYQKIEIGLDLKDIIWKLLMQWKAILVVALIMAALLCCGKYTNDIKTYKGERVTAKPEGTAEERIADIMAALSDSDRESLELIFREEDWLDRQAQYLDESIIMNIDPSNADILKIVYDIDCNDPADVSVVLQNYTMFAGGESYCDAIGAVINKEAETKYINELIYITNTFGPDINKAQTRFAFNIQLLLPDSTIKEAVVKASNKAIEEYSQELKNMYPHKVRASNNETSKVYYYDLINRHKDTIDRINNMNTNLNYAKNAMTAEQRTAFEAVRSIRNGGEGAEELVLPEPTRPKIDIKYAILGFVVGVFAYAMLYLVVLALKGIIASSACVEGITKKRLIGEICVERNPVGLEKLFHSKLLGRYHYLKNSSQQEQIDRITYKLETICDNNNATTISILLISGISKFEKQTDQLKDIISQIANELRGKGIQSKVIDASVINEIDEKRLLNIDNAILVFSENANVKAIEGTLKLCSDYKVNVLGNVFIEEI